VSKFGFLGDSQVKILSVFASLFLVVSHSITIFSVEERVLLDDGRDTDARGPMTLTNNPLVTSLAEIWSTFRTLPEPIWYICKVQAFAWGGWFPIL
jgi:solute carrier family 45 protein 1/2/4